MNIRYTDCMDVPIGLPIPSVMTKIIPKRVYGSRLSTITVAIIVECYFVKSRSLSHCFNPDSLSVTTR